MINWWAVLVGAGINMFVGFLWYGPLFGSLWLRLMGTTRDKIESGGLAMYLLPIAGAVASATVLAVVISLLRVYTVWAGMMWGAILWIGFGGTGLLTTGVFEGRRQGLSWLFIAYMVVVHAAQGALFAVWR